jgi:type I restriction enzyme S subunit
MKWKLEKLSTLCEINVGKTPSRDKQEYFGSGVTWVSIADMNNKVYIESSKEEVTDLGIRHANMKIVDTNTVLFSFKLSVGKVCITSKPVYTNEAIAALPIIDNNRLFTKYLYYAMQAQDFSHLGETAAKGLTLNKAKLNTIRIPLPPLPIQQKIAAILDEADALRRKDKALLAKYDELLQSVFYDMFGDPVKNEKGWEVKRLSDLVKFLTSGSRGWAKYYSETGELFLRINNVGKNNLQLDEVIYVNAPLGAEGQRTKVEFGDILLSITADLGRTAVIPRNFPTSYINQHLALIRLIDRQSAFYVSQYIASEGGRMQLLKSNKGGVKAGLNFDDIRGLEIPLPPTSLQMEFEKIAQAIQHQKSQIIQQQTHSEALFQSLMQRAFAGRLVG